MLLRWSPLRLQTERPVVDGVKRPNRCLADFVAPRGVRPDYIGLFAVTAGLGVEKIPDFQIPGLKFLNPWQHTPVDR